MKALLIAGLVLTATPNLAQQSFAQQSVPQIPFDSVADFPKLPSGMNFGEVPGVAVNTKTWPFEFTATPGTSPKFMPFGIFGKSATESKGIWGALCWAKLGWTRLGWTRLATVSTRPAINSAFMETPPVFYPPCGFVFHPITALGRRNKRRGASVEDLYTSDA